MPNSTIPEEAEAAFNGDSLLLRLPTVLRATGLARSTVYKLVAERKFPAPVELTARAVAWRKGDVERWASERPVVRLQSSARSQGEAGRTIVDDYRLGRQASVKVIEPRRTRTARRPTITDLRKES